MVPFNPSAIDCSQLVPPTFTPTSEENESTEVNNVKTCQACGSFLANPLVQQGLIPESMANILIPPPKQPSKSKTKRCRMVTEGRVISGDQMLHQLKEKEEMVRKQEEAKEERLKLKERRREEKEKELEEKNLKKQKRDEEKVLKERKRRDDAVMRAIGGRLAHKRFTCGVCGERGRLNDEDNGIMWYVCEERMCENWYHEGCLSVQEREFLMESVDDGSEWYCKKCKPWVYDEE